MIDIPTLTAADLERFSSRHEVVGDCWEWKGQRTAGGYGAFVLYREGRELELVASRVAWSIANGPIPFGLFVLHTCDNRPCVNPAHLFVGTHVDNMADMVRKGRSASLHDKTPAARNRLKTHCPKCGGPLVESHHASQRTSSGKGRRRCTPCKATQKSEYMKAWRRRRRQRRAGQGQPIDAGGSPTSLGPSGGVGGLRVRNSRESTTDRAEYVWSLVGAWP